MASNYFSVYFLLFCISLSFSKSPKQIWEEKGYEPLRIQVSPLTQEMANETRRICGDSYQRNSNFKIKHGHEVLPLEHPWIVLIHFETPTRYYYCTGTLISPKHLITGAHCFLPFSYCRPTVFVARTNSPLNVPFSIKIIDYTNTYRIMGVVFHPNTRFPLLSDGILIDDVAIAELDELVSQTLLEERLALPICLPKGDEHPPTIVAGWGGKRNRLQRMITRKARCRFDEYLIAKRTHRKIKCFKGKINRSFSSRSEMEHVRFPTLTLTKTFQGDSGTGIMEQGPDHRWHIIGVFASQYPDTDISLYTPLYEPVTLKWIKETLGID